MCVHILNASSMPKSRKHKGNENKFFTHSLSLEVFSSLFKTKRDEVGSKIRRTHLVNDTAMPMGV